MHHHLPVLHLEGPSLGLTEADLASARAAFAAHVDHLAAAGRLITTEVLDGVDRVDD